MNIDPVILILPRHLEQGRPGILIVDDDVDRAVVVQVAKGATAAGGRRGDRCPSTLRHIFEATAAGIVVQHSWLMILGVSVYSVKLRVDVSIAVKNVEPAVI